ETGPVLVTHWGLSGPAILRLSAWGARQLFEMDYKHQIAINWCPEFSLAQINEVLMGATRDHGKQQVRNACPVELPKRLWQALVVAADIAQETRWAEVNKKQRTTLARRIVDCIFDVDGKTTNKEEFVTSGGVSLKEVNFKTMGSRVCEGLFFAGEVLNIDGITGGFNFQSCWTTGYLAGEGMARFSAAKD
ncbi:MAG: putative Rossmann fold flavoprotein, partial [Candidatus Krumholzibacteriia bacterium]